jgi:hypothetical protein
MHFIVSALEATLVMAVMHLFGRVVVRSARNLGFFNFSPKCSLLLFTLLDPPARLG